MEKDIRWVQRFQNFSSSIAHLETKHLIFTMRQSFYPYKELDTLHFFRPVENDTLVFYGEIYKYPFYKGVGGCDCCDDVKEEYLQQSFKDSNGKYKFKVVMAYRYYTITKAFNFIWVGSFCTPYKV